MKPFVHFVLGDSRHNTFHLVSLALCAIGMFVVATATDLGPFAPPLLAMGIYLVLFSILLQLFFWGKVLLRKALASWLDL